MNEALQRDACNARAEAHSGRLRGPALLERLLAVPSVDRDPWVDELLALGEPPPDLPNLPPGAVPYLPAAVDDILTMVREVPLRPEDELVDLGSGMGRVVMLAHLLSGVRARGIELQEPLVHRAREAAARLGLDPTCFIHGDAAQAELDGSVFFLYAPFNGQALTRVLRRLEDVARRKRIVVAAVALELPGEPWLQPRLTSNQLTVYDSRY